MLFHSLIVILPLYIIYEYAYASENQAQLSSDCVKIYEQFSLVVRINYVKYTVSIKFVKLNRQKYTYVATLDRHPRSSTNEKRVSITNDDNSMRKFYIVAV